MNKKFYVTTPIYYVNDVPHIGHAYTTIAADVLARYHRLLDHKVFFLTGTDEHGAKVAEAAKKEGKKPKQFCDRVVSRFINSWKRLNISNDYFIRTTNPRHEKIVKDLLKKIYDNGYIYSGTYEGLYCVGCEKFLTESDLIDGKCPLHPNREPVRQKEKNYFFKLSDFREKLIRAIENEKDKNHYKILPEERKNEILGKLKQGLDDVSISRAKVEWGIPIPWDKTQTTYVWIDALLNYYTSIHFLKNKKGFWPPDLHLIGKDILWFHAVIWEAFLLAAKIPLPKAVYAHGFFTINGQKMSKSLGNVISPDDLIEKFGVDGARYLMLCQFPFGTDGDISLDKFKVRYNADLANGLGNLVARVAKLCEKSDFSFKPSEAKLCKRYQRYLDGYRFDKALVRVWQFIAQADRKINQDQVWQQKDRQLEKSLKSLVTSIRRITYHLKPFLPETAEKIEKQFAGPKIKAEKPLFPRL